MKPAKGKHVKRESPDDAQAGERLQKILAAAGIGSRRKCEELILTGRVEVDREVVTNLGAKADPQRQEIRLDGMALPRPRLVHYVVHKPVGVVSTNYDQSGRPRVVDLVPKRDNERLFAVGRLDLSSEGLMLLTNDGELANRLTHPRYGVEKTYHAEVAGAVDHDALAALRKGTHLAEGFARVASARVRAQWKKSTILEIVLAEGRNREIRRLLAREGHKVLRLTRVAMGPLRLAELPPGGWRPIDSAELRALRQAAFASQGAPRRKRTRSAPQKPKPLLKESTPTIIGGDARPAAPHERSSQAAAAQPAPKPRSGDRRPHGAGVKRSGQDGRKLVGPGAGKKTRREGKPNREGKPDREGKLGRKGKPAGATKAGHEGKASQNVKSGRGGGQRPGLEGGKKTVRKGGKKNSSAGGGDRQRQSRPKGSRP